MKVLFIICLMAVPLRAHADAYQSLLIRELPEKIRTNKHQEVLDFLETSPTVNLNFLLETALEGGPCRVEIVKGLVQRMKQKKTNLENGPFLAYRAARNTCPEVFKEVSSLVGQEDFALGMLSDQAGAFDGLGKDTDRSYLRWFWRTMSEQGESLTSDDEEGARILGVWPLVAARIKADCPDATQSTKSCRAAVEMKSIGDSLKKRAQEVAEAEKHQESPEYLQEQACRLIEVIKGAKAEIVRQKKI